MSKFYLTLAVEAANMTDAAGIAASVADYASAEVELISPDFQIERDNDDQVVVYTGLYGRS